MNVCIQLHCTQQHCIRLPVVTLSVCLYQTRLHKSLLRVKSSTQNIISRIFDLKLSQSTECKLFPLQDCRRLKNFSSLRAILSALQSNAVYRLRKTWAAVSRQGWIIAISLQLFLPVSMVVLHCVLHNRPLMRALNPHQVQFSVTQSASQQIPLFWVTYILHQVINIAVNYYNVKDNRSITSLWWSGTKQ